MEFWRGMAEEFSPGEYDAKIWGLIALSAFLALYSIYWEIRYRCDGSRKD